MRPETGRVTKRKSDVVPRFQPFTGKFSITVSDVCQHLDLNEFPVSVTERSKKMWAEWENFETFYLPLVATVNPGKDPYLLITLARAKWNEIINGKKRGRKVIFRNPGEKI